MRILTRYMVREFMPPFLFGIGIFSFIFLMGKFVELTDLVIKKKVDIINVLTIFYYSLPAIIAIVIPMAVLLAILLVYGRLAADNEVIAFRSGGYSMLRLIMPMALICMIICPANIIFNDSVLPYSNHSFKNLLIAVIEKEPLATVDPKVITQLENISIYVKEKNYLTKEMHGVTIFQPEQGENPALMIYAGSGKFVHDEKNPNRTVLKLKDGTIHQSFEKNPEQFHVSKFKTYYISINTRNIVEQVETSKSLREMTSAEIKKEIAERKSKQEDISVPVLELHKKVAIPFACLFFVILGPPLVLLPRRANRLVGVGIGAIIIFFYYIILTIGTYYGERGFHPAIMMWLPNIVTGIAGVILLINGMRK